MQYSNLYDKAINGMTFQCSKQLDALNVKHGFTSRAGGVSEGIYSSLNLGLYSYDDDPEKVRENYARVCAALDIEPEKIVFSKQVHADNVRVVTKDDAGKGLIMPMDYEADGLVTDVSGLTLSVFGADCLTILLYEPEKNVCAAAHAGWRGTTAGIIQNAVNKMTELYGCDSSNIRAVLGPCISKCCFETSTDVPDAMKEAFGSDAMPYIEEKENGKFMVDLKGLNAMQLAKVGVLPENIEISADCTMCLHDKYWSHRYTKGQRGIQAALICLP